MRQKQIPAFQLKKQLKEIGHLNRSGMQAGNNEDFKDAHERLESALKLSEKLGKHCLEAKIRNNMGILFAMQGKWDKALFAYDDAMEIIDRQYGKDNFFYRLLQKNILQILQPDLPVGLSKLL